jgi:hypothetical protein
VWHAGAVAGYHTVVVAAPDQGWAVVVQQNLYSPLHDAVLNSAAFGALTITLGGIPDPAPTDGGYAWILAGLGSIALALGAGVVWTVGQIRRPRPFRRRALLGAGVWTAAGLIASSAVGLWLPGAFELRLRHVLRFMPDVGHLMVAVVLLGLALALSRLVLLTVQLRRR